MGWNLSQKRETDKCEMKCNNTSTNICPHPQPTWVVWGARNFFNIAIMFFNGLIVVCCESGSLKLSFSVHLKNEIHCSSPSFSFHELRPGWPDWANFRPLGDCLQRQSILNYRSSPNSLAILSHGKIYVYFSTKNVWAAFWAFCSQTHLVTLAASEIVFGCIPDLL
jgi:hypothetical protein